MYEEKVMVNMESNAPTTQQFEVRVANLDCEHDAAAIERGLRDLPGIAGLEVYPKSAKVAIAYDPAATTPEALKERLEALGFPPLAVRRLAAVSTRRSPPRISDCFIAHL